MNAKYCLFLCRLTKLFCNSRSEFAVFTNMHLLYSLRNAGGILLRCDKQSFGAGAVPTFTKLRFCGMI